MPHRLLMHCWSTKVQQETNSPHVLTKVFKSLHNGAYGVMLSGMPHSCFITPTCCECCRAAGLRLLSHHPSFEHDVHLTAREVLVGGPTCSHQSPPSPFGFVQLSLSVIPTTKQNNALHSSLCCRQNMIRWLRALGGGVVEQKHTMAKSSFCATTNNGRTLSMMARAKCLLGPIKS